MPAHLRSLCLILLIVTSGAVLVSDARAQRPEPEMHGVFDGDTMFTVLPPGAIPAIHTPAFVTGDKADLQMSPDEPVIGVVIAGDARAYSLWHLDSHEIVNDVVGGTPIAVTW